MFTDAARMSSKEAKAGEAVEVEDISSGDMSSGDQASAKDSLDQDYGEFVHNSTTDEGDTTDTSTEDSLSTSAMERSISDEMRREVYSIDDEARRRAINYCLTFTVLLFTLPLAVMYFTYRFLLKDYFGFDDARAALYAGGVAAVLVIVLVAMFVWIAYREEKHDAALLKKES
uniref:VMA21-like domain protein n=1 Tax=Ascaris lumbricoides TaxID=6252 RepID=A0A0M3ITE9_ASCLU